MIERSRLIVLKFGTTSVCNADTLEIKEDWMQSVAVDVKELISNGDRVIIFSSGGLATGKKRGRTSIKNELLLQNKNLLGALGLSELLFSWQKSFDSIGLPTATLTIREEDVKTTPVCSLIREMVSNGITPIINENIPLQSAFNNDALAAEICNSLDASQFILFTDTNGIFTDNPKVNPNAKHLKEIDINEANISFDEQATGLGSGGMKAKLQSAIKVRKTGTQTIIANGTDIHPLKNLQNREKYTVLVGENEGDKV